MRSDHYPRRLPQQALLSKIVARIPATKCTGRSWIIGIDGVDLSGKTSLAHELAEILRGQGKQVILIHEDDFLQTSQVRYRRGKWSVEGFYEDFFDFRSLLQNVLLPVSIGKPVSYRFYSNAPQRLHDRFVHYTIGLRDYVLVEGLFLLRNELQGYFDLVIRLKIPSGLVMERAITRDVPTLGSYQYVKRHYETQVLPAQARYEQLVDPDGRADIVVENSDILQPIILKE